jgi:HAD superfamily hydrolase (TIGR01509 family)
MRRVPPRRAIVFDLDGTLIDSMTLVFAAIAHAIEPYRVLSRDEIFAKLGGPPERFMSALLEDERHVPAALLRLERYDRDNQHLIQPFADTLRFLETVRAANPHVQLAIWTGRDRESGTWLLRTLQLEPFFATVVYGDDLASHKPSPEGLHEIMKRLGVAPAETLFVGDADVDVLGGVASGVDTILIEHGRAVAAPLRAQAWRAVESPAEAFEIVRQSVSA